MSRLVACIALTAFPYAFDGITEGHAKEGDALNVPEHLVDGLVKAELIKRAEEEKADTPVDQDKSLSGAPENKGDDRAALVARAAELNLEHHPQLGVPKLKALIEEEEARLAAAADDDGNGEGEGDGAGNGDGENETSGDADGDKGE